MKAICHNIDCERHFTIVEHFIANYGTKDNYYKVYVCPFCGNKRNKQMIDSTIASQVDFLDEIQWDNFGIEIMN